MSDAVIAANRFGLGARADDPPITAPRRWLISQFDQFQPRPAAIAELPDSSTIATETAQYYAQIRQLQRAARQGGQSVDDSASTKSEAMAIRKMMRQQARAHYIPAVGARAQSALTTPAPFVERLVHFWANHFAVSVDKPGVVGWAGYFEFEAIRPHVLGNFRDMLFAVEQHAAMLFYLDQVVSIGPDSAVGRLVARRGRRKLGINENLGREAMELHTLGVRTGYSQADVTEFARALTGWTVAGIAQGPAARLAGVRDGKPGSFIFAGRLHEPGARTIMGKRYDQSGEQQAVSVFDDLIRNSATAHHIAFKLARHFAGDTPPPTLVARLEKAFVRSNGDLPTLYSALVEAPEAWVAKPLKFKTPWEWTISALRGLGAQNVPAKAVFGLQKQLGQPVWNPGSPAGYDDIAASWMGPDAIMRRVEAASRLAAQTRGSLDARTLAPKLIGVATGSDTERWIGRAASPDQALALMLISPEFMRR
ncbi:DUF1800 family protein [Stakelama sediminis]|uniref:Uncharacterized protein (DUF1800 family) n=1 Tax=Stakelama sediminis TaxID=463200 RepID=A0A840YUY2_9SPHN|nr:DUF1800 domain-containing protein [Stakelama sediminis]MBB5717367.1 uncharacterized protein (DUF1800 family) [Stakelama sediminis]